MPGSGPGTTPGTPDSMDGSGDGPGVGDTGGAAKGVAGKVALRNAKFLGLPQRDRQTIQQSQSEKYPQQYASKVEQYLKNLADEKR